MKNTEPFPCGDCGQMVEVNEKHTYTDCLIHKNPLVRTAIQEDRKRIKSEFTVEVMKKMGDNWTYGQIDRFINRAIYPLKLASLNKKVDDELCYG